MDRVILLHFGGSVSDQFELVGMRRHVLAFDKPPSFNELVGRVRTVMNVGCDMRLHGRYDMGGNRPIYVMVPLGSEDEWQLYKACARESGLKGAEVVAECALLHGGEMNVHGTGMTMEEVIIDRTTVEVPSQEECQGGTHRVSLGSELARANSESLNLALVRDEFDVDMFDQNLDNEQNVDENDASSSSESDEENIEGGTSDEGNESNMPQSAPMCDVPTSSRIDWRLYYTEEELRALKSKHINLFEYPKHKDISHIESAVCDSAVVDDEENPRVRDLVIKKGQLFESLDAVKFFFQDYAVRHHRPFYVAKSNKNVRYIIRCQIESCSWGVWLRRTKNEIHQWRVSRVKQPHTCGTSVVRHIHSQCTAKYLGRRIVSIVWADSDITVAALIEVIHGLTTYRVRYGKAWRAKEHALALLWGDWKEAYAKVPRILSAISHFNPGTKCVIDTGGKWLPNDKGQYFPVLKRVFWCFPQCVAGFAHCRPIISVDGTFLTGKYKGTLMVAVGITAENHLLPLAFALVEGENNDSWSWFLTLVRKEVLGAGRSICMISDRHRGLLNGAKEHLEGYPPIIHRWCTRHFAANIWKKQRNKEVINRLKALCKVKEEKIFERRLQELEKILNNDAKAWLFEQLSEKSKWALAFDEGGCRYGVMTTNISEVFNFVLKGIRSLPVSGIVDYTFNKCNQYFVARWEKARNALAKGERWGGPGRKHLLEQGEISNDEVAAMFDPAKLVYEVKSSSRTNIGGEVSGGRIFRVEIGDVVSCTCMTPALLHLPCSHVITACRMRHVLHEGSNYMSPYYSLSAEEKTWEARFEPLLDPSQWPLYEGLDYVPDVGTRKMRKGRRKKKRFRNEMDDMEKGYGNDMYGSGDFDEIKSKVHCSVCHGEGHTMDRHKEGPKRNPKMRGAAARNS